MAPIIPHSYQRVLDKSQHSVKWLTGTELIGMLSQCSSSRVTIQARVHLFTNTNSTYPIPVYTLEYPLWSVVSTNFNLLLWFQEPQSYIKNKTWCKYENDLQRWYNTNIFFFLARCTAWSIRCLESTKSVSSNSCLAQVLSRALFLLISLENFYFKHYLLELIIFA